MVRENGTKDQFDFRDPGASVNLMNNSFEDYLVNRFKEGNPARLFLIPHNSK